MLQIMAAEGVGNHQVEQQAWRIQANREAKKGNRNLKKMKKGTYEVAKQRDQEYIVKEMKLRAGQVKRDWQEDARELRLLKEERLRATRSDKERNRVRREFKRITKENEDLFQKQEKKNESKIN